MEQPTAWKTRVVGYGKEAPDQLLANPRNWRIHPKDQQDALEDVLDQVGWVKEVIVNKTTGAVVDGHLRVGLAISRQEPSIPVSYVELSEDEERAVIATLDPLGGLAETDESAYEALVAELEGPGTSNGEESPQNRAIQAMLTSIQPADSPQQTGKRPLPVDTVEVMCPGCAHEWEVDVQAIKKEQGVA